MREAFLYVIRDPRFILSAYWILICVGTSWIVNRVRLTRAASKIDELMRQDDAWSKLFCKVVEDRDRMKEELAAKSATAFRNWELFQKENDEVARIERELAMAEEHIHKLAAKKKTKKKVTRGNDRNIQR